MSAQRPAVDWYIVVGEKAHPNFLRALQAEVWGAKEARLFQDAQFGFIQPGDRVHFVITPEWAGPRPAPEGFPRILLEHYQVRGREIEVEVTSPVFRAEDQVWPDDLYPWRFRFRKTAERERQFVPGLVPDAVRDAVRISHLQQGRAQPAVAGAAPPPDTARAPTAEQVETSTAPSPADFSLRDTLQRILTAYPAARREPFSGHPLAAFIRQVPQGLRLLLPREYRAYAIEASAGQGNWAGVPWIAIRNPQLAPSVQSGPYVVYLFAEGMDQVYLCLSQGVTDLIARLKRAAGRAQLARQAQTWRSRLAPQWPQIHWDDGMHLGNGNLAQDYKAATMGYLAYRRDQLPKEDVLREDLLRMLQAYRSLGDQWKDGPAPYPVAPEDPLPSEMGTPTHARESESEPPRPAPRQPFQWEAAMEQIRAIGYAVTPDMLANILISLLVRPFVILSGRSGTGKTSLARILAHLFGWDPHIVAVNPAWADPTDLFGYLSPLTQQRVAGPLEPLLRSSAPTALLCLDEFNVAKVEHYFSDFISAMDHDLPPRFWGPLETLTRLNARPEASAEPLRLPPDLLVIATMNFDDSVQSLTPRMLDRAHVIEMDLEGPDTLVVAESLRWTEVERWTPMTWPPLARIGGDVAIDPDLRRAVAERLRAAFLALAGSRGQFGHRPAQEILRYCAYGTQIPEVFGQDPDRLLDHLFDRQLVQRLLPKFHGTGAARDINALLRLLPLLDGEESPPDPLQEAPALLQRAREAGRFPRTAAKVEQLVRTFQEDGYASYW
ncbi:MAG: DUF3578 domain-containing protein [Firmicutes bacterium]|nr:DUF3578 domain-containing protein [Alicyclobacillaceae bacterium]MCL6497177.1 DUF3578 domain-containing protein [Bacillota bacterium]